MSDYDGLDAFQGYQPPEVAAIATANSVKNPNPGAAASALQLAPKVGLPPAIIQPDVAQVQADQQKQQNIQIMQQHPEIAAAVGSSPTMYQAMSDDMPAIAGAKQATSQESFFGNINAAIQDPAGYLAKRNQTVYDASVGQLVAGAQEQEKGRAASLLMEGDRSQLPYIKSMEDATKHGTQLGVISGIANMVGSLFDAGKEGTAGAVVGAGIGAAAGGVGAAPGAIAGFEYGTLGGLVRASIGNAYLKSAQYKDEFGNPLPESARYISAIASGTISGILMSKMGNASAEAVTGLVNSAMSKVMADAVVQRGIGSIIKSAGNSGLAFGLLNVGQAASDSIIPQMEQAATGNGRTIFNDPKARGELFDNLVGAMRDGFTLGAVFGVLPVGLHPVIDKAHQTQVESEAANRDSVMEKVEATQLKTRAPEVLARILDNGRTVDVSADKIAEVRAADPTAFSYIPDVEKVVAQAQAHGGDVSIPYGDYFAKTSGETHELVKDDIRGEGGLTVNDAKNMPEPTPHVPLVEPKPPTQTKDGVEFLDTRNQGTQYHGTSEPNLQPDDNFYTTKNYYGQGFYTTDAADIAYGYSKRGANKTGERNIYRVEEKNPGKLFDMEAPLDPSFIKKLSPEEGTSDLDNLVHDALDEKPKNLRELYDTIRDEGTAEGYSADTIQEIFTTLAERIEEEGYTGLSHKGGLRTNNELHRVNIYFRPERDLTVTKDSFDNFKYTEKVVEPPVKELADPVGQAVATHIEGQLVAQRRLMATDKPTWLGPILDADAAGMTKSDFARISKHMQDLQTATTKAVYDAVEKEVARREKPLWKDALAKETENASVDLRHRPDIYADRLLRTGELPDNSLGKGFAPKLDREAAKDLLGHTADTEGDVDPTAGINPAVWSKDGLHPDQAARLTKHENGLALLRDLKDVQADRDARGLSPKEHLDVLAKEEATRRVEETHGKFDDVVREAALDAAMSVKQIDVLVDEINSGLAEGQKLTRAEMERQAGELFKDMNHLDAGKFEKLQRLAGRAGDIAWKAANAGDHLTSLKAKQLQAQNLILARMSREFKKFSDQMDRTFKPYTDNLVPDAVDHEFVAQIQRVLSSMGVELKRDGDELGRYLKDKPGLNEFVDKLDGRAKLMPAWADRPNLPMKELTTSQFTDLMNGLKSLDHIGRDEKMIQVRDEKLELAEVHKDAIDRLQQRQHILDLTDKTKGWPWVKDRVAGANASLMALERVFSWFDFRDPDGPFAKIMNSLQEAKYKYSDFQTKFSKEMDNLSQGVKWLKSLDNEIKNSYIYDSRGETGTELRKFNRHNMLNIMSHMGSELNFTKMVEGENQAMRDRYGEHAPQMTRTDFENLVNENATLADWKHVTGRFRLFDKIWPLVEAMHTRLNGVAPLKREPRTIQTQFGPMEGGYMPLRADSRRATRAGGHDKGIWSEGNTPGTLPPAGYSKDVTQALYPLDFGPGNMAHAMRETLYDLSYREALINASKFLLDRKLGEAVENAFGTKYKDLIRPWLEDTARSGGWAVANRGIEDIMELMKQERHNYSAGTMALRATITGKHATSTFFQSLVGSGGVKGYAQEMRNIFGNPLKWKANVNYLMEKSGELRSRWESMNQRDFSGGMDRSMTNSGTLQWLATQGHKVAGFLDMLSAAPVFQSVYKNELMKHGNEDLAVATANKAVRDAHGSYNQLDQPAVMRNNSEMHREAVIAYKWFNHVHNQMVDTKQMATDQWKGLPNLKETSAGQVWTTVALTTLVYTVGMSAVEEFFSPSPKKKDEPTAWWLGRNLLRVPAGGLPYGRDLFDAMTGGTGRGSPMVENGKAFYRTMSNVYYELSGHQEKMKGHQQFVDAARAAALVAPIPGATQIGKDVQFLWDVNHNYQRADTFDQWIWGLLNGKSNPRK